MLFIARNLWMLSFGALMEVYREGNLENGRRLAPSETEARQLQIAEQDFYTYLRDCFFTRPGAAYCVLEENGKYISALRLEPYEDGLLLEALETAPALRGRGYASRLIREVQQELGNVRIYSHVSKKNIASLKAHRHCGFEVYLDFAAYLDGSVNNRAYTLRYEKNFEDFEKKN